MQTLKKTDIHVTNAEILILKLINLTLYTVISNLHLDFYI